LFHVFYCDFYFENGCPLVRVRGSPHPLFRRSSVPLGTLFGITRNTRSNIDVNPFWTGLTAIYKYYLNSLSHEVIKVADLPLAAVVRIAKKSGAERVGSDAAAALIAQSEEYIAELVKKANKFAMHAGRKTIKEEDVELAAKEVGS
jgi:histone H3/H4